MAIKAILVVVLFHSLNSVRPCPPVEAAVLAEVRLSDVVVDGPGGPRERRQDRPNSALVRRRLLHGRPQPDDDHRRLGRALTQLDRLPVPRRQSAGTLPTQYASVSVSFCNIFWMPPVYWRQSAGRFHI